MSGKDGCCTKRRASRSDGSWASKLSEHLNQIARQNLERNRSRLSCQHVELVTGDLATTPVPDDMTVSYMFNPVEGQPSSG